MSTLKYIPNSKLFVSEPNPMWFGNPGNEKGDASWTNTNWLKSRFHFSFAEYRSARNSNFGVLRVMNDDLVQPHRGFGTHPHQNMEICTYIVQGKLTHQDSIGTKESLGRGSIQFMTAGTGVRHSEHNLEGQPLRFIQMWLTPTEYGLSPNYGSMCGTKVDTKNKWGHLVSWVKSEAKTPVKINSDANIKVAQLDGKAKLNLPLAKDRQAYFLAVKGTPVLSAESFGCQKFQQHDAAELYGGGDSIELSGTGHVLIVEMAKTGEGRSDF